MVVDNRKATLVASVLTLAWFAVGIAIWTSEEAPVWYRISLCTGFGTVLWFWANRKSSRAPVYEYAYGEPHRHDYIWECTMCGKGKDIHYKQGGCFWGPTYFERCTLCGDWGPDGPY